MEWHCRQPDGVALSSARLSGIVVSPLEWHCRFNVINLPLQGSFRWSGIVVSPLKWHCRQPAEVALSSSR